MFTVTRLYSSKEFAQPQTLCLRIPKFPTFMVMEIWMLLLWISESAKIVVHVFYDNYLQRIWSPRYRYFRGQKGKSSIYFNYQNILVLLRPNHSSVQVTEFPKVVESLNLVTFSMPTWIDTNVDFGGSEKKKGNLVISWILKLLGWYSCKLQWTCIII